ncbi:hypothetical protein [Campylobacter helveticus]|uniref:hypothetical protein n=1 Tax=Campylobacter helveticus TaxID=28898 RepID=UPI00214A185B|nr:hypothetical protein [Campylobacter helveticus]MCR2062508.1 hypothetical protein [Campylobacter helveticus]MCR2066554.1 hypothetical protein [Campylobacter helveticus]
MIETDCYRELTKKTKIKGLSIFSWIILIALTFVFWFALVLYAIPIALILYIGLFTLEFFDEDIYQVLFKKFDIKADKYYP